MDDVDEGHALTPGAHRSIRRLDAQEAALAGELVTDGDRRRVRIRAAAVPDALWEFAGAEHVAGVRDLVRTADGQDALLPWCTDPLETFLARRSAADRPLSSGEIVTLAGSLLRGVAEVGALRTTGRWWLDDDARPLFVPGEGRACAAAANEILERVRHGCADRTLERLLGRMTDAAEDHRVVVRALDEWERELTELAAPRPLEREDFAAERVSSIPVHRARLPEDAANLADRPGLRARAVAAWQRLTAHVSEGPGLGSLRRIMPGRGVRRRRDTAARAPRGRMLVLGAAVAGLVLVGGLLWPGGDEGSVATEPSSQHPERVAAEPASPPASSAAAARETGSAEPVPPPAAGDGSGADPVSTATRLLSLLERCREDADEDCAEAVVPGAGAAVLERTAPDGAERAVTLIDDYGDVAVLRLAATDGGVDQMLVLVRHDDRWLVRDVYDVADQPSGRD
ncbi:hypothetical protein ACFWHT_08060 [Microbacterium sp. NPDC058342]|uniref:hypothetical protein n=1 Tax=Microbacterium sp. NPDC058342 TaxID=3346454 RepID=UPI00364DF3D0